MRLEQKACILVVLFMLPACAPAREQPSVGWTSYTDVADVGDMAFGADGNLWIVHGGFDETWYTYQPGDGVTKWDVSRKTSTRYTSGDGLLEGPVWSIAAGPDGVMWFGVTDGVSCFDGKRWGAYTTAHGLPEGDVVSITAAPDGEIWAGTKWAGISRFDGEAWARYPTADDPVSSAFWSFSIAPDGTVWGGDGDIVARFDGMTWATYLLAYDLYGYGASSITDIAVTSDDAVWVAIHGSGVFHFDDGAWFRYLSRNGLASSMVTSIAIAPDGALWFGTVRGVSRFDGETWTTYTTADGLVSDIVTTIAVAPDGALWFGTDAGLSRYQPPVSTVPRPTPAVPEGARTRSKVGIAYAVAYSPDGQSLALGVPNGVSLYRADLSERVWRKEIEGSWTSSVAFSPDGATLASAMSSIEKTNRTAILWDTATGERVRTLAGNTYAVHSVAFSPDGTTLASGLSDDTIILWDTRTWERVRTLKDPDWWTLRVAFSPDGTRLTAASAKAPFIVLWDTATWEQVDTPIPSCFFEAYSPDGVTVACTSEGDVITLWDTVTGEQMHTLEGHILNVRSVVFSPDGALLASGEYLDGTIILWDTATGERVRTFEGHTDTVFDLAFSPDGTTLASVSQDGTVILWDVAR